MTVTMGPGTGLLHLAYLNNPVFKIFQDNCFNILSLTESLKIPLFVLICLFPLHDTLRFYVDLF